MTSVQTPPRMLSGPNVWLASDFGKVRSWVHELPAAAVAELKDGVRKAVREGRTFVDVGQADFPLGSAARMLMKAYAELDDGPGFTVVSGFPVDEFSYDEALIAYAGISSHFGHLVDQSYAGAMKVDVTDVGAQYTKDSRGYQTNAMLRFHTDGAIYTGLLCREEALEGGRSVLASSSSLSNYILEHRPDHHRTLVAGFHHHRRGEHAPGECPVSQEPIPVFGFHGDMLYCTYDRNQSMWAAEEGIEITADQIAAMDYLDETMGRPEFQLHMDMRKGDIQFVNNFLVLHARTEYIDGPNKKRHLVRYWIEDPRNKRKGFSVRDLYVKQPA